MGTGCIEDRLQLKLFHVSDVSDYGRAKLRDESLALLTSGFISEILI